MRVLIAPDKFKGSLTAEEVCDTIQEAIAAARSGLDVRAVPMADGGEGTAKILTTLAQGTWLTVGVHDPLGRDIDSGFGVTPDGKKAFLDLASASGLGLLQHHERNPLATSTFGTGELILAALNSGVTEIVLGLGGSATNDGGMGMASALGARFLDKEGNALRGVGADLIHVHAIDTSGIDPRVAKTDFLVLTDVANPLIGIDGASNVYATQKGADSAMVKKLEEGMVNFAAVLARSFVASTDFPGAGAAGGVGAAARIFLKASVSSGAMYVGEQANLEGLIGESDLVITGEGKTDRQTLKGKVVSVVAEICRKKQKNLWIVTGINELSAAEAGLLHAQKFIQLATGGISKEKAMLSAKEVLYERIFTHVRG